MSDTSSPTIQKTTGRLLSIDALRGWDMFWIIGGDALATSILKIGNWSFSPALMTQLEHADWEGFRFYDLIFPLFLFMVGCVLPFSLEKYRGNARSAHGRILRRTLLMILLGLIYSGLLRFDFANLRYAGVLQRIAICYGVAGIIFLHVPWKPRIGLVIGILFGYWALLSWVAAPGGIAGDLTKEGNLAGYIDRNFLPGKILEKYYGFGDNEGILSTIPAIVTALLGVFAGEWLRSDNKPWTKVGGLLVACMGCLAAGYGWSFLFPIIKNLWTSSFVLVAAGWSLLLLTFFYTLIDVLGWRTWSFVWVVIGMNAITIYIAKSIIDFTKISKYFLTGVSNLADPWQLPVLQAGTLLAMWLFLYFLYKQKIFLRV